MTFLRAVYKFLLLASLAGSGEALFKRWLKNTNFENPLNWNAQRVPCGNDRVIIPDESPVIYLQINTTLQELTLPRNGEIIFGNNVNLAFTQEQSDSCPPVAGDVDFSAVNPASWLNPDNWCSTTSELADCQPPSPIDTENVPCTTDDVVFPRSESYFVTFGQEPYLTMKSLKVTGTSFTTSTFAQFLNSTDGHKVFQPLSQGSVTITRQGCTDMGGCACFQRNEEEKLQNEICAIKKTQCQRSPCKSPVTPKGACCDLCGVVFNGTRGRGFNLTSFNSLLQQNFLANFNNVLATVSITASGYLQLVLKDEKGGNGSGSSHLGALIKADVDADLKNGGHKYALDSFILAAGDIGDADSSHYKGNASSLKGGPIAGIVIAIIFIIAIIAIAVLFIRQRRPDLSRLQEWPNWFNVQRSFSRFKREPPSGSATPPHNFGSLDAGFKNPLYDSAPFDDTNVREMEMQIPTEEQPTFDISGDGGFDNPLYGTKPGAVYTDASATSIDLEATTTTGFSNL